MNTKIVILMLWCTLIISYVSGQKIDSLKSLLPETSGADRCDVLYELAYEFVGVDNEIAKKYGSEGYQIATQLNDTLRIVKNGRILASALRRIGKVDSAIQVYSIILPIARVRQLKDLKILLNSLAISYTFEAQYDKALELHFESLNLRQQDKDTVEITIALHNIGIIYYKLKDYDKALVYFKHAFEIINKNPKEYDLSTLLTSMSLSYAYKNDIVNANYYYHEAIRSCGAHCTSDVKIIADFILGLIYYISDDFVLAEKYFLKSMDLAKQNNEVRLQLDCIVYLSQICLKTNRVNGAVDYLESAERLINQGAPFNLELIKIYSELSRTYALKKEFERTAFYQDKYIQLKDSIYNENFITNLMKVESNYLDRENKARLASQEQVLILKEEAIRRQRLLNVSISLIAIVLITFTIMLFKRNRQKKTINQLLELKVKERTKELELNQRELLSSCKERDLIMERLAQSIQSSLATIKGLCTLGLKDITDPAARQYISKMNLTSEQLEFTLKNLQALGALHD